MSTNGTPNCVCVNCGTQFHTKPSALKRGRGRFCSCACYYASKPKPLAERFWRHVDKDNGPLPMNPAIDRCWIWVGRRNKWGYGQIADPARRGYQLAAHRLSYDFANGSPGELFVCHHCDNPSCVNPGHLFLGTNNDNRQDSVRKNRHAKGAKARAKRQCRGTECWASKLDPGKVRQIRSRLALGEFQDSIAIEFGVTQGAVSRIKLGKGWKHV